MLGNEDAARTDFHTALRVVEARFATQSNSGVLLSWRAEILAALGDRVAVEPLLRELRQRLKAGEQGLTELDLALPLMYLGREEEALVELEARYGKPLPPGTNRMTLRYNPLWDPLRGNPRFEALLKAKPPGKK